MFHLVIIAVFRWLYWTDTVTDTIQKASMDGTSRTVLHSSGLSTVYGLTLDYENQILYWMDYSNNRIESSNVDGSNRIVLTSSVRDPYSVTFYNGTLYWGDWYFNRILTTSVSSPTSGSYLSTSLSYDPFGVQIISRDRQPDGMCAVHVFCKYILLRFYHYFSMVCDNRHTH